MTKAKSISVRVECDDGTLATIEADDLIHLQNWTVYERFPNAEPGEPLQTAEVTLRFLAPEVTLTLEDPE